MAEAGGYILNVAADRREALLEAEEEYGSFAEAVPWFSHSRNLPLVCFISFERGFLTHIGKGRRGLPAATGMVRLNVTDLVALRRPIRVAEIIGAMNNRVRHTVEDRLGDGGLLPPASFASLIEAISGLSEEAAPILELYARSRRRGQI